ncbi:hypothetical protein [Pseudolactococcus insecticola]|uniref:Prevent-host-death protein n=1 Tax=Pseudolactococcus insecticola TaxID=2709158 RepID=A0A6A0B7B2_9LACT|nr:hypothetical protein [Lactococcus insecticola]GFH40836.1 hypothetical protein Hs20B_12340 [Lactococcus insecticola]
MMSPKFIEHDEDVVILTKSEYNEILAENKRLKAQIKFDNEIEKGYVSLIEDSPIPVDRVLENLGWA